MVTYPSKSCFCTSGKVHTTIYAAGFASFLNGSAELKNRLNDNVPVKVQFQLNSLFNRSISMLYRTGDLGLLRVQLNHILEVRVPEK